MHLYQLAANYQRAFLALADIEGLDEPTINDTLEGLEGEMKVKAQAVCAHTMNIEAEIDAMKAAEKRIADRRKAAEKQAEWFRAYLLRNMRACGIGEINADDGSFRARIMAGRESVQIDDESLIPKEFMRQPEPPPPAPDKRAISDAFKAGNPVSGCSIVRTPTLKLD